MATKLYFHDAANALSGTFPTGEQSTATPTHTASGANTLRTMDRTIGSSQVTVQVTHDNSANTTYRHFYRFFCSAPVSGAQTVGGGTATVNVADAEDAANINHWAARRVCCYVWRPSTGALVGKLFDGITTGGSEPTSTSSEQVTVVTFSTTGISAADGDVVILEVHSDAFAEGNRTSADTWFYYDGTTENTTENAVVSNHASFLSLAEDLVFDGEGGSLTPSLYVDTDTFFSPTVTAGVVNLAPSLYTDGDTFHAATVSAAYALTPSLHTDSDTFFDPVVAAGAVNLAPALYTDSDTFFGPTVSQDGALQELTPSLYADADTFHAATVAVGAVNLAPALYTDSDTFFSATVSQDGATQNLAPVLFADADTFFSPAVTVGAVNLAPSLHSDSDTFFSATVSQDGAPQVLTPSLYADSDTFFDPTVGAVYALAPALYTEADTFFGPTVGLGAAPQALLPSLYTDADTFFGLTVVPGAVNLAPALYTDIDIFPIAHVLHGGRFMFAKSTRVQRAEDFLTVRVQRKKVG